MSEIRTEKKEKAVQMLSLENREKFSVSGVEHVEAFSETMAVLHTNYGRLTIRGAGMKLQKLDAEDGVLTATGARFSAFEYSKKQEKRSFFERVFR